VTGLSECLVCSEPFAEAERVLLLPCLHWYHAACIRRWLLEFSASCPLCRKQLRPGDIGRQPSGETAAEVAAAAVAAIARTRAAAEEQRGDTSTAASADASSAVQRGEPGPGSAAAMRSASDKLARATANGQDSAVGRTPKAAAGMDDRGALATQARGFMSSTPEPAAEPGRGKGSGRMHSSAAADAVSPTGGPLQGGPPAPVAVEEAASPGSRERTSPRERPGPTSPGSSGADGASPPAPLMEVPRGLLAKYSHRAPLPAPRADAADRYEEGCFELPVAVRSVPYV
jgi:hypothetical protein